MPFTETINIVAYISRNPKLTPSEFYTYWSTTHAPLVAPWAEKHGILSYRQIHTSGTIVPNIPTKSGAAAPTTPQPYDGFVIWEVPSMEVFQRAFADPYYVNVIELDEHNLIDKNAFAGGIVANFHGPSFEVLGGGKSKLVGEKAVENRKAFEEFERKAGPKWLKN